MAPWPGRLSSVTQITIATDEAVVVVEWSLSGRKLFPGQSTPGKMGLWVDFWGNGSRGRDRLGRRMNLVVVKTMSTVQLLLAKLKERVIWPDIMFMSIRSVKYFLDPIFQKQTTLFPTQTVPQVSQVTSLTRRCPYHPPPPVTTCHLPLLSTFTRIISQAPPSAPPLQRAAPRTTTTTANHPTQAPHTIFFSNDTTTRDSPIARRVSHRRRRHPTSRATQSRQADPTA